MHDDTSGEDIIVTIDADGKASDTSTFSVPNTSDGSGRFEFFLMHAGSLLDLDKLDPDNSDLAEGMTGSGPNPAPLITFGQGGELDTGEGPFRDVEFNIHYQNLDVAVGYKETSAELVLDRDLYGSDNHAYLQIHDSDANLNPTRSDEFTILASNTTTLFEVGGGSFQDDTLFRETNRNSGIFEAELLLTRDISSESPTDINDQDIDFFEWSSESARLSLNDRSNYDADVDDDGIIDITLDDPDINDSTESSEVSIAISDKDGLARLETESITFASEMRLVLTDNDQNRDSRIRDEVRDAIRVSIENDGADEVIVDLKETEENSGIFKVDLPNNELELTFCGDTEIDCPDPSNSILEFRSQDVSEKVILYYADSLNRDGTSESFRVASYELNTTVGRPAIKSVPGEINAVYIELYDPDLDDNARTPESYSFTLLGTDPIALKKSGGLEIGEMAQIEVELEGDIPNYDGSRTFSLRETGANTGNFTAKITGREYQDIANLLDPLGDQELVEFTYHDRMESPDQEATFSYRLALRITPIIFSRIIAPIPATDIDNDGMVDPVSVNWTIIDPAFNDSPASEETIPISGIFFNIVMIKPNGEEIVILDRFTNHLADILLDVPSSLRAMGPNSEFFSTELEFKMGGQFPETEDWQNAQFKITYIEDSVFLDDDKNRSRGITFTGHSAVLTANATSVHSGQLVNIMVEDDDLNLDDSEVDIFETSLSANNEALLTVETEDKALAGITKEIFRETGPNTGIFEALYKVGRDLPITRATDDNEEADQATRILVTYNDKLDATGSTGDEIELELPVISSTGTLQASSELAAPSDRITITLTDIDLDQKSTSSDSYEPRDTDTDDFFVTFRTNRNEVGVASPQVQETGPSSGIFEFTLDLKTDEKGCRRDDLGTSDLHAVGGNNPSVGVCPGDIVSIKYEDKHDATGGESVVSALIHITSFDPSFVLDKADYDVGDKVIVIVADPDANRNPDLADSLSDIRITTDKDKTGKSVSAIEVGRDTGSFMFSFLTSSENEGGAIAVEHGSNVTIEYTDRYPEGFQNEETERKFEFSILILGTKGIDSIITGVPIARYANGTEVVNISADQQIILTTQIVNSKFAPQEFVVLIEVIDNYNITQLVSWHTEKLELGKKAEIGSSWMPQSPGSYTIRTFAVDKLDNPTVLSRMQEAVVNVGG
ncbi:MAG TPA: hypothetical protein VJP79_06465 [Nitrososphaera sp.]|nr:hypothetical protein [Nitrososphaera sp.]